MSADADPMGQTGAGTDLVVGQRVWIYDVNDRRGNGPISGTVEKVGRVLATIRTSKWEARTYRLDTGRRNDNYQHQWFRTDAQREADDARRALEAEVRGAGVRFEVGVKISDEVLAGFVRVLREAAR